MFNRETLPSIVTLQAICDAFGITLSDFFKEENTDESFDYGKLEEMYKKLPHDIKSSMFKLMKSIADSQ